IAFKNGLHTQTQILLAKNKIKKTKDIYKYIENVENTLILEQMTKELSIQPKQQNQVQDLAEPKKNEKYVFKKKINQISMDDLPRGKLLIDGKDIEVNCLFDSGSTHSFIRKDIVDKHKFETIAGPGHKIEFGNGNTESQENGNSVVFFYREF
ncbi:hypothetical protein M153_32770003, partial [Pseudoloma neurophilia]